MKHYTEEVIEMKKAIKTTVDVTYCDICGKMIRKEGDVSFVGMCCGNVVYETSSKIDVCKKCADKIATILTRALYAIGMPERYSTDKEIAEGIEKLKKSVCELTD